MGKFIFKSIFPQIHLNSRNTYRATLHWIPLTHTQTHKKTLASKSSHLSLIYSKSISTHSHIHITYTNHTPHTYKKKMFRNKIVLRKIYSKPYTNQPNEHLTKMSSYQNPTTCESVVAIKKKPLPSTRLNDTSSESTTIKSQLHPHIATSNTHINQRRTFPIYRQPQKKKQQINATYIPKQQTKQTTTTTTTKVLVNA